VYDMYPWNARGEGPRTRPPAPRHSADQNPARHAPAAQDETAHGEAVQDETAPDETVQDETVYDETVQDEATRAVQVALDRRDNGGDADATPLSAVPLANVPAARQ
jgi:hypothetical protein